MQSVRIETVETFVVAMPLVAVFPAVESQKMSLKALSSRSPHPMDHMVLAVLIHRRGRYSPIEPKILPQRFAKKSPLQFLACRQKISTACRT
jgi:hypothetical protein